MTITLNHTDSGQTIDEEVADVCRRVKPEIFCTCNGMRLLYIDCENIGWNPIEYVKVNGQFALLTRHSNHPSDDPVTWWFMRDPSRNYEFSFHHSTGPRDTNKIFLWWDDLKNLPEVEYGQWHDQAIRMVNCTDVTLNLKAENVGTGLYMHNCHGCEITASVKNAGKGVHHQDSHYNQFNRMDLRGIGHIGYHPDGGSAGNLAKVISFWNVGMCQSSGAVWICGADKKGNPTRKNHIETLHGGRACYGRFWPLDGSALMWEQGVRDNTVGWASIADSFTAIQDNSGMPGNSIETLYTVNCENTFDQSDSSRHGQGDPIEKVIPSVTCINSGPFGVRTPKIPHAKIVGERRQYRNRYTYPLYPDLPAWHDFKLEQAANLEAKIPWQWKGV
jgi:hypothetical protein